MSERKKGGSETQRLLAREPDFQKRLTDSWELSGSHGTGDLNSKPDEEDIPPSDVREGISLQRHLGFVGVVSYILKWVHVLFFEAPYWIF